MILEAIAGIGSLLGGAAAGAVNLGASVLGGLGSAAGGLASATGQLVTGGAGLLGKTAAATAGTAGKMASTGLGVLGGLAKTSAGIGTGLADILGSETLAHAAGTAGGIYSLFNPPKVPDVIYSGGGSSLPAYRSAISNTLPAYSTQPIAGQPVQGGQVFTTPAAARPASGNNTILLIAIGIVVLLILKKGK